MKQINEKKRVEIENFYEDKIKEVKHEYQLKIKNILGELLKEFSGHSDILDATEINIKQWSIAFTVPRSNEDIDHKIHFAISKNDIIKEDTIEYRYNLHVPGLVLKITPNDIQPYPGHILSLQTIIYSYADKIILLWEGVC